jgi:BirA family biotin operon repressor/biotin-[acetyl-CoA-carboxylase] ligase
LALFESVFTVLRMLGQAHGASTATLAATPAPGISLENVLHEMATLGVPASEDASGQWRLARPFDALDATAVMQMLEAAAPRHRLVVADICASTNSDILPLAGGLPAGAAQVLAAELQTAGRGRRGRSWVSGLSTSLTFSVLRRFDAGLPALAGLSLATGLAVAQALEDLGARGVALKWPNDILLKCGDAYAKLGGILIELGAEPAGTRAVIGIGLNVRLPAQARAQVNAQPTTASAQPVADLAEAGLQVARNRLLAAILRRLQGVLDTFAREGFTALRGEWNKRHAYQGAAVLMINDGRVEKSGTIEGVDAQGALRLATTAGLETLVSGELSLRPAA